MASVFTVLVPPPQSASSGTEWSAASSTALTLSFELPSPDCSSFPRRLAPNASAYLEPPQVSPPAAAALLPRSTISHAPPTWSSANSAPRVKKPLLPAPPLRALATSNNSPVPTPEQKSPRLPVAPEGVRGAFLGALRSPALLVARRAGLPAICSRSPLRCPHATTHVSPRSSSPSTMPTPAPSPAFTIHKSHS